MDSITGQLQAATPLDYERDSNIFYMRVRATEEHVKIPLSAEVDVRLLLKDLNDNAPEFVKQRYLSSLPESAPVGTTVASVTAIDKDSGINGQFHYHVSSPFFKVNQYTGDVITSKALDYETAVRHAFQVWAVNSGSPPLNGTARIVVELKNVNDNPPIFTQSVYQVSLSEDAQPNELVATGTQSNTPLAFLLFCARAMSVCFL